MAYFHTYECGHTLSFADDEDWREEAVRVLSCPSWHFLPGPMQDDEDRANCQRREQHSLMRRLRQLLIEEKP